MDLGRSGFVYEPIGQNTRTPAAVRKNIGTLIVWGLVLLCALAVWGSSRTSFQPSANPASTATLVRPVGGGEVERTVRLMGQVRVFVESYRGTTNTTYYGGLKASHSTFLGASLLVGEPYRENVLEADVTQGKNIDDIEFRWNVEGVVVGSGTAVTTVFGAPGEYRCSVVAYRTAAETVPGNPPSEMTGKPTSASQPRGFRRSTVDPLSASPYSPPTEDTGVVMEVERLEFVVTVKYIRREIRKMTDRDRETFFNAVAVMQRVPSAVGRAVYGNKYYSKDYFNRMHLYYGGRRDCDHWHDGAGFVTSHIAITLMYEQSLQAVNPSIALPYWDVTIEGTFYDWSNFRTSSVFADDWFGDVAPQNTARTTVTGRFAFVPTMANATEYSGVVNPYGMLRSPWNTDRNPFMTRSDTLFGFKNNKKPSGCRKYRDATIAANWMQQTESFNGGAHGNIHGLLGGTWSAEADEYAAKTPDIVLPFIHHIYISQKIMWRTGHIDCPDTCTIETPWEDCRCTCSEAAMAGKSSAEFLQEANALTGNMYDKDFNKVDAISDSEGNAYEIIPGYTKEETDDIYDTLLMVLCIPTKVGSHFESTSSNDITFHVLHPTFDRLWHLTRLKRPAGFDETWIDDAECYGHNSGDVQPFHDLFPDYDEDLASGSEASSGLPGAGDDVHEVGRPKSYYSNRDLYDLLHPGETNCPYIYDNFEWPHCDAVGVYLDN